MFVPSVGPEQPDRPEVNSRNGIMCSNPTLVYRSEGWRFGVSAGALPYRATVFRRFGATRYGRTRPGTGRQSRLDPDSPGPFAGNP
jgi:hypothetical protein